MSDKKVIAVVGATGAQGGGVARAILDDPGGEFTARAITRNVGSDKAAALAARGAEVVAADLDDRESLERAFDGAHGAFCVTAFWEHFSPEKEQAHALNMAEAAAKAGLLHVIWSTLEDMRQWVPTSDDRMPTLQGKYSVPHYDGKGEANKFFTNLKLPVTLLNTSFYWENFIHFGMGPKRGPDGVLTITLPMGIKRLPGISVDDIGKCAYGIFRRGNEYIGRTVGVAGEHLTGQEMADAMTKALGEPVQYNAVSPEAYRAFGFPGADDLGNMFQVKHDFEQEYVGGRDIAIARALNPDLQTFSQWLASHKDEIPR